MPTFFLSHGGGPWPWMKNDMPGVFDELDRTLKAIPSQLPSQPKAIVVITSHWIEKEFSISSGAHPKMIYDYGGFPKHTYSIQYPAPGSPVVAKQIEGLLQQAGIPAHLDPERGFDHGTYTVTYPMYPDASIPVVQVSVKKRFDPQAHLDFGRALTPLRGDGVLILGSGLSYHNLGAFGEEALTPSTQFDQWLQATMRLTNGQRAERLKSWSQAPAARQCHPREDHLIPLMVVVGAAEFEPSSVIYHEDRFFGGCAVTSFRLG